MRKKVPVTELGVRSVIMLTRRSISFQLVNSQLLRRNKAIMFLCQDSNRFFRNFKFEEGDNVFTHELGAYWPAN